MVKTTLINLIKKKEIISKLYSYVSTTKKKIIVSNIFMYNSLKEI